MATPLNRHQRIHLQQIRTVPKLRNALIRRVLATVASTHAQRSETTHASARPVVVASKPFGESLLLAEMFAQLLEARGIRWSGGRGWAPRRSRSARCDGGDRRVSRVHGHRPHRHPARAAARRRGRGVRPRVAASSTARWGMHWLPPLGFENTYAIAVRTRDGAALRPAHPERPGARRRRSSPPASRPTSSAAPDGLPGLASAYGLRPRAGPLAGAGA